jgi:hypothetical protein
MLRSKASVSPGGTHTGVAPAISRMPIQRGRFISLGQPLNSELQSDTPGRARGTQEKTIRGLVADELFFCRVPL